MRKLYTVTEVFKGFINLKAKLEVKVYDQHIIIGDDIEKHTEIVNFVRKCVDTLIRLTSY